MVHTINRIAKQLVSAMIVAALLIGGSLTLINETKPLWGETSSWSIMAFIFAGLIVLGMLRDIRKGDKDGWGGWKEISF
jgi:ubiquinone biosynthesis protein